MNSFNLRLVLINLNQNHIEISEQLKDVFISIQFRKENARIPE